MQTFLVKKSFAESMKCIDKQRLFNQFEECMVILKANLGDSEGYKNHPAAKMWRGYEHCLIAYAFYAIHERPARGGNVARSPMDHGPDGRLAELRGRHWPLPPFEYPPWRNDLDVYRSHRSNLIRKDRNYYEHQFPNTPEMMPYLWPIPDPTVPDCYQLYISKPDADRMRTGERILPDRLADKVTYKCPM